MSKTSNVIIRDVKSFLDIPKMFDNSGIYRKWSQVADDIGKLQLQTNRPLCLCFGLVKVDGVYKYFPNSVLTRFSMEGANTYRDFPLVTDEYSANLDDPSTGKTYPNIFQ